MEKRLGQNFLINQQKLEQIAGALDLEDSDTVIEIGAGHGELTREIRNKCRALNIKCEIIAIEKDRELALMVESLGFSEVEVITGDGLKIIPKLIKPRILRPKPYKIAGNIPYYLTGRLLRIIGELEIRPVLTVVTLQIEVAERICAKPPKMNLLAASVQFWALPKIIGYIPKESFRPKPKVDSAIIKLKSTSSILRSQDRRSDENNEKSEKYYLFLKKLFKQPRKTILNNLIGGEGSAGKSRTKERMSRILTENDIDPNKRPQDLDLETLKLLSSRLFFPHL